MCWNAPFARHNLQRPESMRDIHEIRKRLESAAEDFCEGKYLWRWDETRMHLLIEGRDGTPIASLHVEKAN